MYYQTNNIMKKIYTKILFLLVILTASFSNAQDLVHYWNFNDNSSIAAISTVTTSLVPGASIVAIAGGTSVIDPAGGTGQNFDLLNLNAQNGAIAGTHLRFNTPIGGALEFALPTTSYENVIVNFATKRSGSGADDQVWSYSTDGGNTYTALVTINPANGDPTLQTLDFTAISAADDNADFKLKVEFAQGAGGIAGNNRFDNFSLKGTPLGGDTSQPVVTIDPADQSNNVSLTVNPTISFNEDVRLVNNDAINNTNVDAIVALRLDDAAGAIIPFDATFTGNVITIIPNIPLNNGQNYYVALLSSTIEDLSDNSVNEVQSSIFTTAVSQEAFTAGDFAIVAYRMSATGSDDEIAFVTFVDIPNGTNINFTDGKYTTNPQAQCSGGFVWTAAANSCIPAGSVITIKTNVLTSNMGMITGTGFGLSSNGDQVIVYTGTAANPNYITALTSNGWINANIECAGSLSMIPAALTDGINALNTSTAPDNVSGNAANGFYNGTQIGAVAELRASILNPNNWTTAAANTTAQTWPVWNFPTSLQVGSVAVINNTTIQIVFSEAIDGVSGSNLSNYTGIPGLVSATITAGNVVTLTYAMPFGAVNYTLTIANIQGVVVPLLACAYDFNFDGTLAATGFFKDSADFAYYPNPSDKGVVSFNRNANVSLYDCSGKLLIAVHNAKSIDTSGLAAGMYFLKTSEGISKKLIVK